MIKLTAEEIVGEHTQPGVLRQQAPKIIGMLLWIARNTRPDISYGVSIARLHELFNDEELHMTLQRVDT